MNFSDLKPNDIQRAVKGQRIDRAAGAAPAMGRVSRMPGAGRPKEIRRKRYRGEGQRGSRARERRRRIILRWSILLGIATFGAIVVAVALWMKSSKARSTRTVLADDGATVEKRVVSRFKSPSKEEALQWVKLAMLARDPESVKRYFRLRTHPPGAVVRFLEGLAKSDGPITGYTWYSSIDRNGLLIDGVLVREDGGSNSKKRLALLTPDEKGVWKIDYEAFARICDPSWNEVLDPGRGGGLVRVIVADDTYYNGVFADDAQWSCYRMSSPDVDEDLLGYCHKDSPQAKAMARIMQDAQTTGAFRQPIRAVLEIKRVAGAERIQFEITRVLAEDWAMSDIPFDEHYR